ISGRLGLSWSTFNHSASDITTTAVGVGAERFAGSYHLTHIPQILFQLKNRGKRVHLPIQKKPTYEMRLPSRRQGLEPTPVGAGFGRFFVLEAQYKPSLGCQPQVGKWIGYSALEGRDNSVAEPGSLASPLQGEKRESVPVLGRLPQAMFV
ncbi:MAG: hypothetical protein RBU25_05440, partial [Lentisphaeria bacterium]|nr:hypothetical protein [Lentisphaeria bacterium]